MNRSLDFGMVTNHRFPGFTGQSPDNMDENKVLLYYRNLDHIVAGLSNSTQNILTILLYGLPRNNQSRF
jgi:hypothetical protein